MRAARIGSLVGVLAVGFFLGCGEAKQGAEQIADEAASQVKEMKEDAADGASGRVAEKVDAAADKAAAEVERQGLGAAAADAVEQLEANVEESVATEKETYEKERAEGKGMAEAAGDAYEAVLEEGTEKAEQ